MGTVAQPVTKEEKSSLVVRIVRTEDQLEKARRLRSLRYESIGLAYVTEGEDAMDYDPYSTVFLAEERATGLAVATMRFEVGLSDKFYPSDHLNLPTSYKRSASAYATRSAATPGPTGTTAAKLIVKAGYHFCMASQVRWVFALGLGTRTRRYLGLGFVPLPESPEPKHWPDHPEVLGTVMVCDLFNIERHWRETDHPNYPFYFGERSPEIEIFSSLRPAWDTPRVESPSPGRRTAGTDDLPVI